MRIAAAVVSTLLVIGYAVGSGIWVSTDAGWYRALERPPWQPPDIVFGLIWPYNFLMLIIVGILIALTATGPMIGWWLGLLTASIVAALAWAYLFYVPHALWASTVALGLAFVLTVPLVIIAWRTQWWAGVVLLPYAAWLGIATSLAAGYATRNPG